MEAKFRTMLSLDQSISKNLKLKRQSNHYQTQSHDVHGVEKAEPTRIIQPAVLWRTVYVLRGRENPGAFDSVFLTLS